MAMRGHISELAKILILIASQNSYELSKGALVKNRLICIGEVVN